MSRQPLIMVGGKGGVGKTTCSSAIAARFALQGRKTLLITSDMTPSLSDIFEENIGDKITSVGRNLDAFEISQNAIAERWKKRFGPDFYGILSQLIDVEALDSESRHQILDYIGSAPSLREETMLDLIVDMAERGDYEQIVWDTAPAGETLNLLAMPKFIKKHLRAGARVFEGLDKIGKQLIGRKSIADTMDEWIALSDRIAQYVHDRSTFIVVANPEALVVSQVKRLMKTLVDYLIEIHGMIINCVIEKTDSPFLKTMSDTQSKYIAELRRLAGARPVTLMARSLREIRGKKILVEIGERLVQGLGL